MMRGLNLNRDIHTAIERILLRISGVIVEKYGIGHRYRLLYKTRLSQTVYILLRRSYFNGFYRAMPGAT